MSSSGSESDAVPLSQLQSGQKRRRSTRNRQQLSKPKRIKLVEAENSHKSSFLNKKQKAKQKPKLRKSTTCAVCKDRNDKGALIRCIGCLRLFHKSCHSPRILIHSSGIAKEGNWMCSDCLAQNHCVLCSLERNTQKIVCCKCLTVFHLNCLKPRPVSTKRADPWTCKNCIDRNKENQLPSKPPKAPVQASKRPTRPQTARKDETILEMVDEEDEMADDEDDMTDWPPERVYEYFLKTRKERRQALKNKCPTEIVSVFNPRKAWTRRWAEEEKDDYKESISISYKPRTAWTKNWEKESTIISPKRTWLKKWNKDFC